jgi:hypothetical protein
MFEWIRMHALRLLRVPHDPVPPTGAPGSVKIFRAGQNFYRLKLVRWGLAQIGAMIGIVVSLGFLANLERGVNSNRSPAGPVETATTLVLTASGAVSPTTVPPTPANAAEGTVEPAAVPSPKNKSNVRTNQKKRPERGLRRVVDRWPPWVFTAVRIFEYIGIVLYLAQLPLTYALVRLDYELRWYIVTDRSLRIRAGLTSVQESTMSFANVQQVAVSQGPLQRLLGIADLRVQSAGGGSGHEEKGHGDSLHTGVFHGVDNASEIRDLILERLRLFRQAGLGDPDDAEHTPDTSPAISSSENDALAAARELLQEAQSLTRVIRADHPR